jgi:hypothetical protein
MAKSPSEREKRARGHAGQSRSEYIFLIAARNVQNFCDEPPLTSKGDIAMDERRTLSILGWAIGSVVGVVFILNAIALSLI